ncbi:hypothetical protein BGZ63DRAFT_385915 [Mariannaea sp. PMI_226]|nr:hypothetical protein BGZ63DRAFT_385915 [Mariannaea sp. PMI_226]
MSGRAILAAEDSYGIDKPKASLRIFNLRYLRPSLTSSIESIKSNRVHIPQPSHAQSSQPLEQPARALACYTCREQLHYSHMDVNPGTVRAIVIPCDRPATRSCHIVENVVNLLQMPIYLRPRQLAFHGVNRLTHLSKHRGLVYNYTVQFLGHPPGRISPELALYLSLCFHSHPNYHYLSVEMPAFTRK